VLLRAVQISLNFFRKKSTVKIWNFRFDGNIVEIQRFRPPWHGTRCFWGVAVWHAVHFQAVDQTGRFTYDFREKHKWLFFQGFNATPISERAGEKKIYLE